MYKAEKLFLLICVGLALTACNSTGITTSKKAHNPVIWADVPDISMIRVGDTYYMSSTTMHMNPGVPIMKSENLVDWELASYAYETLGDIDPFQLENGQNAYGGGTWASSLRYHNGLFYVSTFSNNSNLNYLFYTDDPEKTPWQMKSYQPKIHDHSLFFDDDGKIYMLSCGGNVGIREVEDDFSGVREETTRLLIENADAITGKERGLPAEGAQMFKVDGRYYIFLISWPKGGMRTVLLYRADQIMGPYEGKVVLEDKGIAQGGFVDTPDGKWYGYFFGDRGAVGRIPYIVPMEWEDGWPVFGDNGIVPDSLNIVAEQPVIPAIVASDEFSRRPGERDLPLVWQWNHNPNNNYWSVSERPGYLRLTTFRSDNNFTEARNTLTQRTFGPACSGEIVMDVSRMKDGDFAGLGLLQEKYGVVGIKMENGRKFIFAGNTQNSNRESANYEELEAVPFNGYEVYFRAEADFRDQVDTARFYYSLDGKEWTSIGTPLKMAYTLSHFMGYRFALFNYATTQIGGSVDFDYFRVAGPDYKVSQVDAAKKAMASFFQHTLVDNYDRKDNKAIEVLLEESSRYNYNYIIHVDYKQLMEINNRFQDVLHSYFYDYTKMSSKRLMPPDWTQPGLFNPYAPMSVTEFSSAPEAYWDKEVKGSSNPLLKTASENYVAIGGYAFTSTMSALLYNMNDNAISVEDEDVLLFLTLCFWEYLCYCGNIDFVTGADKTKALQNM